MYVEAAPDTHMVGFSIYCSLLASVPPNTFLLHYNTLLSDFPILGAMLRTAAYWDFGTTAMSCVVNSPGFVGSGPR